MRIYAVHTERARSVCSLSMASAVSPKAAALGSGERQTIVSQTLTDDGYCHGPDLCTAQTYSKVLAPQKNWELICAALVLHILYGWSSMDLFCGLSNISDLRRSRCISAKRVAQFARDELGRSMIVHSEERRRHSGVQTPLCSKIRYCLTLIGSSNTNAAS